MNPTDRLPLFETASKFDLSPVSELLEYSFKDASHLVEALTDILAYYSMTVPDEEVLESFRTNISVIYELIDTFRNVDKRTKNTLPYEQ